MTVGEDVVVLDVAGDAYHCLPGAAFALSVQTGTSDLEVDVPEVGQALAALGARRDPKGPPVPRRPPPILPTRRVELAPHTLRLPDRAAFAGALSDALVGYVGRGFKAVLANGRGHRSGATSPDPATLAQPIAAFEALVLWTPGADKCLYRAFLLRRFLARFGYGADWVFGVQTWPFTAHCWLQVGDLALDERPERLAGFTPILVI